MKLLELKNITVHYGVIPAVRELSFSIKRGQIVTLVGANGAGKTTTLKTIMGVIKPTEGHIVYQKQDLLGLSADKRVTSGIALVPEGRQIFGRLTVQDNIMLGAYHRKDQDGIRKDREWIYDLFPVLSERSPQIAGTLSGGEQQMLALGRGLMSHPQLLMLDEPSLGLAPMVVRQVYEAVREINKSGITILLVEQNVHMAMKVSDYAYVVETGEIKLQGFPDEIMQKPEILKAYLGE